MVGFSVSSAERCLAIVELLTERPEGMALGTISAVLGVLAGRGWVRQDE